MSLNAGFLLVGASRVDCIISRGLFLTAFWFFFFFFLTVNEQRFSVKHDFCSPDTLSWVPHSHIRSPFKTSRTGWIFFRLYTCPPVLPSVKRNCYLLPVSNCVCFPYSYIFKADRSNLWGKVSHFLFTPFSGVEYQKFGFRYMAERGKEGSENCSWEARWRDGGYTMPPFSEWSLNRGVLWSPSHTLSWGQAGEKKHLCA